LIDIPEIDYHSEIVTLLNSQIQEYSDLINEEANEFYDRRLIAYERIQFILGMWKIPIKLFGSCASGITIKNSDIDIAVDNSILNYFMHLAESSRLRGALEQL
jgi:DNA polymerase sigma